MPPRIFIQTGIRFGQKSQFNSKRSLGSAKPWPCPTAICPKNSSLSALQLHGPCLPQPSQNLLTQHGRGWGGPPRAPLPHNHVDHGPRPGRLCHPLVPPEVTASSSVRSEPPKEGREGASRRVEEVREGAFQAHCPHLVEAQGPDSPDLAPASPPKGISTSSDDWVEWPL